MPGKIKTRIICARNLPIMDRSSDSSDAFVEVRFGTNCYDKTHVCKKTLDPEWNSRFVFEVEEDEIQEEPLQIRVLDHDTYSSHDAIGKVYIDLKPLLSTNGPSSIMGWFPIYDTMHGIRGEIKIQTKVEIFNDCNEYRKSSCGVDFFCSSKIPDGYVLQNFCGFVEELVINDDPEYQWIDKIRTPRTSNETRQKLFSKLSGELQRRIGLKVLDMDANCVLGYLQNFDLEGEHGIVVRGIGTAANIYKNTTNNPVNKSQTYNQSNSVPTPQTTSPLSAISHNLNFNNSTKNSNNNNNPYENTTNNLPLVVNEMSSFKDDIIDDIDNKSKALNSSNTNSLTNSNASNNNAKNHLPNNISSNTATNTTNGQAQIKLVKLSPSRNTIARIHSDSDLNNYHQFNANQLNMQSSQNQTQAQAQAQTQPQFQQLQNDASNRQSVLDKMEYPFLTIQQYPIGFVKSISGIVCARSVKLLSLVSEIEVDTARDKWWIEIRNEIRSHMKSLNCHAVLGYTETKSICEDVCVLSASGTAANVDESYFQIANSSFSYEDKYGSYQDYFSDNSIKTCKICHIPYPVDDLPFPVALNACNICTNGQVPDVIFTTIQPLPEIKTIGQGCLLRAIVTRPRKKCSGEISAKIISDYLPFMEYELHRQLLGKLKLKAMNMIYGLRIQISIGENLLIGIAEATACYAAALSVPMLPKIMSEKTDKTKKEIEEIEQLKKLITNEMNKNKEFFNLNTTNSNNLTNNQQPSNVSNDENKIQQINNSSTDSKAIFKIELDDVREKDAVYLLLDSDIFHKKGVYASNVEYMPGISKFNENIQMFTSVYRCETSLVQMNTKKFNEICDEILQSLHYKFYKIAKNFCLTNLSFDNSLYDDDHAMIIITGCCQTFSDNSKSNDTKSTEQSNNNKSLKSATNVVKKKASDSGIELTNLSYVPNTKIENYLGNINLFLIRESTQIKENHGLSGFMHCFFTEVLALTRSHVQSLGGNALVSFKMNECVLLDNPHRNQGQCLINVSGDAVKVIPCGKFDS